MGCRKCAASVAEESLCESCLAWTTKEALLHHGPLGNDARQVAKRLGAHAPALGEYPTEWKYAYARSERSFLAELIEGSAALTEKGRGAVRQLLDVFSDAVPLRYAEEIMGRWAEERPAPSKSGPAPLAAVLSRSVSQQGQDREGQERKRELLHEQFLWIKRREQAQRLGEIFTEPKPQA